MRTWSPPIRRPRKRNSSSEAPSAQCASSLMMTVGPGRAASAASTARKTCSRASPSTASCSICRPNAGARSRTGPRGPGVERASHDARSTAVVAGSSAKTHRRATSCRRPPRPRRTPPVRARQLLATGALQVGPGARRAPVAPLGCAPRLRAHDTTGASTPLPAPKSILSHTVVCERGRPFGWVAELILNTR